MNPRPVYRTSTVLPVFRRDGLNTNIEFLNYWTLKGVDNIGAVCSLRDQDGVLVDRLTLDLKNTQGHTVDCGAMLDAAGSKGPFLGSIEFEGFSGQDLHVPTPALMAVYRSEGQQSMVHAYTRTYNDYEEEMRLHHLFPGDNYGWPLFDNEDIETYFTLVNGPKEVQEQQIIVDLFNASGEQIRTIHEVGILPPYACRTYTAAGEQNITGFLGDEPGWMRVQFRVEGIIPVLLGGARQKKGTKMVTAHAYGPYHGRSHFQEPGMLAEGQAPYHLPVSIVAPHLPPKIYFYPTIGETTLLLDLHLYDADGEHIYSEPGSIELAGGGTKMLTIDCAPWTEQFPQVKLIDFVARPQRPDRVPSRLHCSIQYGETSLDMSMAEAFKVYNKDSKEPRLRWGMVEQSPNRRTYIGLRNVGFDPEESRDVPVELELWRRSDSQSLRRSLIVPANGSIESTVEELFPEAADFLGGETGWYTAKDVPQSVKTIYVIEDVTSGHISGEHGF